MTSDVLFWKKSALEMLLHFENQASVYKHSPGIASSERGSIFYQIPEGRISVKELQVLLSKKLPEHLPDGRLSETLLEMTGKLVAHSQQDIHSLSSFFFQIATDWKDVAEIHARDRFYSHYHPPRAGKTDLWTLTYIKPIVTSEPLSESFNFINLLENGTSGKPFATWKNPAVELLGEFSELKNRLKTSAWNSIPFAADKTLQLQFDSCNLFHNLTGFNSNMFLVLVINDVEFKKPLAAGEMRFKYLEDI